MLNCRPIGQKENLLDILIGDIDSYTDVVLPTKRLIRALTGRLQGPSEVANILPSEVFFNGFLLFDSGRHISDEDIEWFAIRKAMSISSKELKSMSCDSPEDIAKDFSLFNEFSKSLLAFFKELCENMIDFSTLMNASLYSDYQTHVSSVARIYETFIDVLRKWGFDYRYENKRRFNVSIPHGRSFGVVVAGILTTYETEVLKALSKNNNVTIYLDRPLDGICDFEPKFHMPRDMVVYGCSSVSSMASWIVGTVRKELSMGTKPERIAVVLPDEGIVSLLKAMDMGMFNFTRGFSIRESMFYSLVAAVRDLLSGKSDRGFPVEYVRRVVFHPLFGGDIRIENKPYIDITGEELGIKSLEDAYTRSEVRVQDMAAAVLDFLGALASEYERSGADMEYYASKDAVFSTLEVLAETSESYLGERLNGNYALDFVLGKMADGFYPDLTETGVNVMGVLESRFMEFDAVIIPSLNEGVFPSPSDKELFLNTSIRKMVGLPTKHDRVKLQKSHLEGVVARSERVYLGYIDSEEEAMSHVLREWVFRYRPRVVHWSGSDYLFDRRRHAGDMRVKGVPEEVSKAGYEKILRTMVYSASAFTAYKECGVKFYYRYIKKLSYESEADQSPFALGSLVHMVLDKLYKDSHGEPYSDEAALRDKFTEIFRRELDSNDVMRENRFLKLRAEYFLDQLLHSSFFKDEVSLRPLKVITEYEIMDNLGGVSVVARIDRVDVYQDHVDVIDYKTGSVSAKIDLSKPYAVQMPLYSMLAERAFGKPVGFLGYYDFKAFSSGERTDVRNRVDVDISGFESDILRTIEEILDVSKSFSRNTKSCRTCEFKPLCHILT